MVVFMFQIGLRMHPPIINKIFSKSSNFDRNLEFQLKFFGTAGLSKQLHSTLVSNWNSQGKGIKGWLKEYPEDMVKKRSILSLPAMVTFDDFKLNKFRLNGCKKALVDQYLDKYKSEVKCNNRYCSDCEGKQI